MAQIHKDQVKVIIKTWLTEVDEAETLPKSVKALKFELYEPYGIELTGAKFYDPDGADEAVNEVFEPDERFCPNLRIANEVAVEEVLATAVEVLKELSQEMAYTDLFKVEHIMAGFHDGDLIIIK